MNLNRKSLSYKDLNLAKHYNFRIGCVSIRDCFKKLHLLCKCANTNKCPPPKCMCVSFSQTISPKELS